MCYGNLRNKVLKTYSQKANPNATNSELDAKKIIIHNPPTFPEETNNEQPRKWSTILYRWMWSRW